MNLKSQKSEADRVKSQGVEEILAVGKSRLKCRILAKQEAGGLRRPTDLEKEVRPVG